MRTVILCLLAAAVVHAAPGRRLALVIGANRGDGGDEPLRFAEADASRMARVLTELGGFAKSDVVELKTPDAREAARTMAALEQRAGDEARAGKPPLLLFYYSGHADADALHLAGSHIALQDLRRWLAASPAAVRLVVLDSCKSGALTRVKGAHGAPAIEVRLSDELNTRGEAVLTSSTSDELARESDSFRGSFFTHHLVTGLRGAADRSKDGRVTLAEAYDYAYAHTVAEAAGGQHPTFKFDLAGRGEVVLTSLDEAGAWLDFAAGTDGLFLIVGEDGLVVGDVEVGKTPLKVAVAPGRYEVRKRTQAGDFAVRISLGAGEERWIHDEELTPVAPSWQGPPKGVEAPGLVGVAPVVATPVAPEPIDRAAEQRRGWGLFGIGLGNLGLVGGLLGGVAGADASDATAVLAPLAAVGIVVSSALVTHGLFLVADAKNRTPDPHARAARGLRVGRRLTVAGFSVAAAGIAVGAVGATMIRPSPPCAYGAVCGPSSTDAGVALMTAGFLPAAVALGAALAGVTIWHDSAKADAAPSLAVAPIALPYGAGLGAAGVF